MNQKQTAADRAPAHILAAASDKLEARLEQTRNEGMAEGTVFTFRPMHGFVHIQKHSLEDLRSKGGIIIPEGMNEKAGIFQVLAVGPGYYDPTAAARVPMSVCVGDFVLVDVARCVNASYGGQKCLIVQEADIYGQVIFKRAPAKPDLT